MTSLVWESFEIGLRRLAKILIYGLLPGRAAGNQCGPTRGPQPHRLPRPHSACPHSPRNSPTAAAPTWPIRQVGILSSTKFSDFQSPISSSLVGHLCLLPPLQFVFTPLSLASIYRSFLVALRLALLATFDHRRVL
jgi:hypothetical protein